MERISEAGRPAHSDKEIEVTPEMIEAGLECVYYERRDHAESEVVRIYRAMEKARRSAEHEVEITPEMLDAGGRKLCAHFAEHFGSNWDGPSDEFIKELFLAMINSKSK